MELLESNFNYKINSKTLKHFVSGFLLLYPMQDLEYIVVGLGIAGITFCEQLERNNKSYIVFDKGETTSTLVSAGVINPVVLKRFTPVWNAKLHINTSLTFYRDLSKKLTVSLLDEIPMLRIFNNIEEQNNWVVASDKNELSSFLFPEIINNENPAIHAPFGLGKVNNTGTINTSLLISSYKENLLKNNKLINEVFDYTVLKEVDGKILYKEFQSKKIIFSEGASVRHNPFFPPPPKSGGKHLLIPNKGEYIIVKAPKLQLRAMVKSSLFIIPLGNDLYKVGATYSRENHSIHITNEAKEELSSKLAKIITCNFKVVDHIAGIRPTTRDRRPFLGTLKESESKVFFNGLGTRGITSAPSLAKELYQYLENGVALHKEINIKRYYNW